jgi:pimeloyl-ACP methyl ester carboxylesterase
VSKPSWSTFERDGVRLACCDFGGDGPPALLLHGLAGNAEEWADTAAWLSARCHVVALDERGHGRSEPRPDDVSRAAHVADAALAIERLGRGPALVVGQSLGGHLAILLAARRPALVRALVVVEASPSAAPDPAAFAAMVAASLDTWADELERTTGRRPRFDRAVMERTMREGVADDAWEEWAAIRCPALVVRGGRGPFERDELERMVACGADARLVELPDAGHECHLDQPAAWRAAVERFLDEVGWQG